MWGTAVYTYHWMDDSIQTHTFDTRMRYWSKANELYKNEKKQSSERIPHWTKQLNNCEIPMKADVIDFSQVDKDAGHFFIDFIISLSVSLQSIQLWVNWLIKCVHDWAIRCRPLDDAVFSEHYKWTKNANQLLESIEIVFEITSTGDGRDRRLNVFDFNWIHRLGALQPWGGACLSCYAAKNIHFRSDSLFIGVDAVVSFQR